MNKQDNINQPIKGMNMDAYPGNLDGQKAYTFALNAKQESLDGDQFNLTNEPSNLLALKFPEGFVPIGRLPIYELNKTIYWLVNPATGDSQIGYVGNHIGPCLQISVETEAPQVDPCGCREGSSDSDCEPTYDEEVLPSTSECMEYSVISTASCLGFSIDHPIARATYKLTNKSTEVYWTDNYNPPMWMDIDHPVSDCNQMRIFPDFKVPIITPTDVLETGSLVAGSYQFFLAYSNSKGNELSQYYSATNHTSIWDDTHTEKLDFPTSKSIELSITELDTTYKYFNLAVGKYINNLESFEVVGTYSITSDTFSYVYTGNTKVNRPLTAEEMFFRAPYYNKAGTLETQNSILMLGDLTTEPEINYQSVANGIKLYWETWKVPYNRFEGYSKGTNSATIRGYLRDEVYAFDAVFLLRNGRYSDRFPIPARMSQVSDRQIVGNQDALNNLVNPCTPQDVTYRWQVYNTGSVLGTSQGYDPNDDCYIGPYQYGDFGYWESTDTYPNDPAIWGNEAGRNIRHHKFPDELITPRYTTSGDVSHIYPIGVRLDKYNILTAIQQSNLTTEQRENIIGIKILRGDRAQNRTVQARGMLFNVGKYSYQGSEFLFPNYSFNDLNADVFLSTEAKDPITGQYISAAKPYTGENIPLRLNAFTEDLKNRWVFMSPDTSFKKPALAGTLRLETIEHGTAQAHLVRVQNNAEYEIGTKDGVKMAVVLALSTILSYNISLTIGDVFGISTSLNIDFSSFLPAFAQAYDLIGKLIPFENYGYQYNAVGLYNQSIPVQNTGNKVRAIDVAGYLDPTLLTVPGESMPLNNYQRESSVYIRTVSSLPYTHEIAGPKDNSRFTFSSYKDETNKLLADGDRVYRDISSYYATIKMVKPDQYGLIYSYPTIDTGSLLYLDSEFTTVFGGDTYINRFADKRKLPFFLQNTVGAGPNADIDYSMLGNVSYPTFYLSTGPDDSRISASTLQKFQDAYAFVTGLAGVVLGVLTGGIANFAIMLTAVLALMDDIISVLGIKKVNLDRFEDRGYFLKGAMYLFSYGIPYFFVESDINCDYRQAGDTLDKDFYPSVGTDIPDFWLQEKNVSITKDNFHLYNRAYSKQNQEDFFDHLPIDYDPTQTNVYHHSTRLIYSEPFNLEELQNNWLIYRANNYWDFPLANGTLIDINALEQQKVLTRFEDTMAVYNAFITLPTDNKSAIIGNGSMFTNPPQEFFKTDIGYAGTQHKAFCSNKYGHFWLDVKRGNVFQLSSGIKEISNDGIKNWLRENLPFNILKTHPGVPVDNSYKDFGIALVWDNRFDRLIITKKDWKCINKDVVYRDGKFYLGDTQVYLTDKAYFCPASWTLGYAPQTQSWLSFYSFTPNFYVEQQNFFQSVNDSSLWNHLLTNKSYQMFYNQFYPFEIEPITKSDAFDKTLTSIMYRTDVLRYSTDYDWKYMQYVTFTDAVCYTTQQTTGPLALHPRDKSSMLDGLFATVNNGVISIPVTQVNDTWRLNKIIDVVKDPDCLDPVMLYDCANVIKTPNVDAIDLSITTDLRKRRKLKSDWFKVRLSNNKHSRYKFIFKWLLDREIKSVR